MFGANSPNAIRLLQSLYAANTPPPAPAPRNDGGGILRKTNTRRPPPSYSSSESESSDSEMSISDASTSSYESYEEPADIYRKVVEEKKCAYVSPAGLAAKKTKKEAVKYLKEKGCPDVESLRRPKQNPPPEVEPEMNKLPVAEAAPSRHAVLGAAKKVKKAPEVPKTMPLEIKVAEAPKVAVKVEAPAAPVAAAEKPKRELTAYQKFVQEQRKSGKSMAEAAAAWKAQKA